MANEMGDNMKKLEKRASMLTMVIQQEFKKNHRIIKVNEVENAIYHLGNYYIILHDKDVTEEGTCKTPHYHVVIKSNVARQLKSVMKDVCLNLRIPEELVSISSINDLHQNLRYLVHADDKHKYQYGWDNVLSNDYKTLEDASSYVANLDTNTLIQICTEEENKLGVMRRIGLNNFKKYLSVINNIFEYCHEEIRKSKQLELEQELNKAYGNYCISAEEQARRDLETILRIERDMALSKSKIDDRKPYPKKEDLPTKATFKDGKLNY